VANVIGFDNKDLFFSFFHCGLYSLPGALTAIFSRVDGVDLCVEMLHISFVINRNRSFFLYLGEETRLLTLA